MGRRNKVEYYLDSKNIKSLISEEIKAILRAADELIGSGGRTMLSKILKGSKEKKLIELGLDKCPAYGFYKELKIEDITSRIDWMIEEGYLKIEYSGKLPVIVFSDTGWEIEREIIAEELLNDLTMLFDTHDYTYVQRLKDRNRSMILLLIDKIRNTGDVRFLPILNAWREIEYKKVQEKIDGAIKRIKNVNNYDDKVIELDVFERGRNNSRIL